jgi:hypothetical protein
MHKSYEFLKINFHYAAIHANISGTVLLQSDSCDGLPSATPHSFSTRNDQGTNGVGINVKVPHIIFHTDIVSALSMESVCVKLTVTLVPCSAIATIVCT